MDKELLKLSCLFMVNEGYLITVVKNKNRVGRESKPKKTPLSSYKLPVWHFQSIYPGTGTSFSSGCNQSDKSNVAPPQLRAYANLLMFSKTESHCLKIPLFLI